MTTPVIRVCEALYHLTGYKPRRICRSWIARCPAAARQTPRHIVFALAPGSWAYIGGVHWRRTLAASAHVWRMESTPWSGKFPLTIDYQPRYDSTIKRLFLYS